MKKKKIWLNSKMGNSIYWHEKGKDPLTDYIAVAPFGISKDGSRPYGVLVVKKLKSRWAAYEVSRTKALQKAKKLRR